MSDVRRKYEKNFKKNAVKLSDASNKSVSQVPQDLGISNGMLYRWRQKYTAQGDKTRFATLEEENKALQLKHAELAIKNDMLKKPAPTLQASTSDLRVHRDHPEHAVAKWAPINHRLLRLAAGVRKETGQRSRLCGASAENL